MRNTQVLVEIGYAAIAAIGGMAKYLDDYTKGKKFELGKAAASVFVSGFSGYMFAQFAASLGFEPRAAAMFAGVGGWAGSAAVHFLFNRFTQGK